MREINTDDYDRIFGNDPAYGGVYSKDELPKLESKFYFVNMANSDQEGTHWVLIYNVLPHVCYYFDSFGQYPPQEILKRMDSTDKDIEINNKVIQAFNSIACGYYTIMVTQLLNKGYSFDQIMNMFGGKRQSNEHIVRRYFIDFLPNFVI